MEMVSLSLNQSVRNFDTIRIVYKVTPSDPIDENIYTEFPVTTDSRKLLGIIYQADVRYCRPGVFTSDTTIAFDRALELLGSNFVSHILIPIYIYGVNY